MAMSTYNGSMNQTHILVFAHFTVPVNQAFGIKFGVLIFRVTV
jgi:hypothetical protein